MPATSDERPSPQTPSASGPTPSAPGPALPAPGLALRADLLDFTAEPDWAATDDPAVRWRPDHWLLVGADGRIAAVQREAPPPHWPREEHPGRLLLPGFIDAHVHSPQLDVLASHGSELLDWLARYTFPSETAWADPDHARAGSERFLDALLAHGTTAAVVFPTVHAGSSEALFAGAARRRMRIVTGKVLMDRHAPPGLLDDPDPDVVRRQCEAQIERWHGHARGSWALTVRFAPTSTPAQLAMAGALARADPTLYMQTHVAENRAELAWVAQLFPQARSYLDVYDTAGLLHRRAVLAHGIWLDDADRALLAARGASVAFCPSSNLFLGSGLLDWPALRRAGVAVAAASDVGGGTSLSMQRTLAEGYKVQALAGHKPSAWTLLHAATRGAAQALGLDHEIGTLEPGRMADLCLWNLSTGVVDAHRQSVARNLHEQCFAWLMLSDERHLAAAWVAGQPAFMRGQRPA
jgi:guanine deaminase